MKATYRFRSARGGRRGGVLVLSLVAVGVVAILSLTYLQLSAGVTRLQVAALDTSMSFYMAEAGLAESYSGLSVGHTGNVGTAAEPALHGEGVFWVEATPLGDDLVQLESTGMVKSGKAVLGMVVRRGRQNVGALGIFSEEDLTVPDSALIDGFDSSAGAYAAQAAADPGSVAPGSWYFDTNARHLVYVVRFPEQFSSALPGPARARWRVEPDYDDRDGNGRFEPGRDSARGLRLVAVEPYQWRER